MQSLKKELSFMAHDTRRYDFDSYDRKFGGIAELFQHVREDYENELNELDPSHPFFQLGQEVLKQADLLSEAEKRKKRNFDRQTYIYLIEALYRSKTAISEPSDQINTIAMLSLAERLPGKKSRAWKCLMTVLVVVATISFSISISLMLSMVFPGFGPAASALWLASQISPHLVSALWAIGGAITNFVASGAVFATQGLAYLGFTGAVVTPQTFVGVVGIGGAGAVTMANYRYQLRQDRGLSKAVSQLGKAAEKAAFENHRPDGDGDIEMPEMPSGAPSGSSP